MQYSSPVRYGIGRDTQSYKPRLITCTPMELVEMGDRGFEQSSKETERLLDEAETHEQQLNKPRTCTDTCTASSADSTDGSVAGIPEPTSILADRTQDEPSTGFFLLRGFYRRRSGDGKTERVTPFAVVLLLVLLAVYMLNQADRLVLPVVIPNGLRCNVGKEDCSTANSTNASSGAGNASLGRWNDSSSHRDCIQFNDDQQGLLTGRAILAKCVARCGELA